MHSVKMKTQVSPELGNHRRLTRALGQTDLSQNFKVRPSLTPLLNFMFHLFNYFSTKLQVILQMLDLTCFSKNGLKTFGVLPVTSFRN